MTAALASLLDGLLVQQWCGYNPSSNALFTCMLIQGGGATYASHAVKVAWRLRPNSRRWVTYGEM